MQVILGDGGHARAIRSIRYAPMLGRDDPVPDNAEIMIGLGDVENRKRLFNEYAGRYFPMVVAWNNLDVPTVPGLQLMRGVTLGNDITFGANVLVNTGAQIDHDCVIGDHCVIAPGAILCGGVTLGEGCFIGAGAIIVEGVTLEPGTFVSAGTLVVGQDDMRYPERRISFGEAMAVLQPIYEYQRPDCSGTFSIRTDSDAQQSGPPDGEGAS